MPYRDWAYKIITNENLVERVERGFETEADAEEEALKMCQKGNKNVRYVVYQAQYNDNEDESEEEVFS